MLRHKLLYLSFGLVLLAGCKPPEDATKPDAAATTNPAPEPEPEPEPAKLEVSTGECDETQTAISKQADERAKPYGILPHLDKNFADMKISWLIKEGPYQEYIVEPEAEFFGRCNDAGCFQFAAPTEVIAAAVEASITDEGHDAAKLGKALGLPAENMDGPLRMLTLDLRASKTCVRLPVDDDPGVWKCKSEDDTDCFKFGGYTSGGVPELLAINAPVAIAEVREIP